MDRDAGRVSQGDPLAYFLTWTTYGTWLPGDERGWVAKPGDLHLPDASLERESRSRMTESPVLLDDRQRDIVVRTIAEHCLVRSWHLHAVACRTNHVHVVVTADRRRPEDVMDQLKAWCTRKLKDQDRVRIPENRTIRWNWWTQRGSKRWLNDLHSLETAISYVQEGQDRPRA
jgi:REP element-mobilizing transposase RayT